jgi:hypothetical protein
MSKEVRIRSFIEPLIVLPYGFWAIYFYENGFDWIVAVLAIILFIVIPGIISVFWEKL